MLKFQPGNTIVHKLDPRSKLAFQGGFAIAAFAHTTPQGLLALTAVTIGVVSASRLSPLGIILDLRYALPVLVAAPLLEGLTVGWPYFSLTEASFPALASYRVLLILFVSAAYVHSTPVRDSRTAIQKVIPGKPGQFLGIGVAIVFRFLPLLMADLKRARDAVRARLGENRPLHYQMRIIATTGLRRAFSRSDALTLALKARCFSWNPTLPNLIFGPKDVPVLLFALGLTLSATL